VSKEPLTSPLRRGGREGHPSRRWGIRDAKPEGQGELGVCGGSCTERRGVVISMTGGVEGADRERGRGLFSFFSFFLYHIFVVKVQEIAWSASYGENKTPKPKRTNKGNIRHNSLRLGSVPVPGPHTGAKLKQVRQRKPSLNQRIA